MFFFAYFGCGSFGPRYFRFASFVILSILLLGCFETSRLLALGILAVDFFGFGYFSLKCFRFAIFVTLCISTLVD